MKLVNAKYGISVDIAENQINCLIIENASAMADVIGELYLQLQGGEGNFILLNEGKELRISKCVDCVFEPFSLSVNSKKYIAQLYSEMSNYCNDSMYELKSGVVNKIVGMIDEIGMASMYDITFDLDISLENLFKVMNVRFIEEGVSVKEKIVQYISVVSSLNSISLIIFVHLKSYLDERELQEIYEAAFYHKLPLLMIESRDYGQIDNEKRCIIDGDLCIIEA